MGLKPLNQSDFKMKIIKDLGMIKKPTNKNYVRYAIFECNQCSNIFETTVSSAKNSILGRCSKCAHIRKLDSKLFNIKLIKDLGNLKPRSNSNQKKRYATFECSRCKKEFDAQVYKYAGTKLTQCFNCIRKTHGLHNTRQYQIWADIKDRCYNTNSTKYKWYGAKGITICDEWKNNFESFYNWSLENGYKDDLTIDKDFLCDKLNISPKIYSPETCIFIARSENSKLQNNTRDNQGRFVSML